jgi:hypothetical protein
MYLYASCDIINRNLSQNSINWLVNVMEDVKITISVQYSIKAYYGSSCVALPTVNMGNKWGVFSKPGPCHFTSEKKAPLSMV